MTKIETMDKAAAKVLGAATQEALQAVADRFGVTLKGGGGSFDPFGGSYKPRVEYVIPEAAAAATGSTLSLYDLTLGQTFTSQGRTFEISGFNARATKMPVIATEVGTDRQFKFAVDRVKRHLAVSA